jgi:hypothetical protein
VYKKWALWQPDTLGPERAASLERQNRWRRWWLLRGYFGLRKQRPKAR